MAKAANTPVAQARFFIPEDFLFFFLLAFWKSKNFVTEIVPFRFLALFLSLVLKVGDASSNLSPRCCPASFTCPGCLGFITFPFSSVSPSTVGVYLIASIGCSEGNFISSNNL